MRAAVLFLSLLGVLRAADPAGAPAAKPLSGAELYLMLPEPRSLRSAISRPHAGAQRTVFTPARRSADGAVRAWGREEFSRLGISWETFLERAEAAADRRLAMLRPELKTDAEGRVIYAVYRSDEPVMACLLVAPSLAGVFKKIFGDEIWLVTPDRHSLFVFPPRQEVVAEFAEDLRERFRDDPFAASDEVFSLKSGGEGLRAIGGLGPAR